MWASVQHVGGICSASVIDCLNRLFRQLWHMRWPQSSLGHLDTGTSSKQPLQSRIRRGRSGDEFLDESKPLRAILGGRREDSLETSTVSIVAIGSLRGRPSRTNSRDSTTLAVLLEATGGREAPRTLLNLVGRLYLGVSLISRLRAGLRSGEPLSEEACRYLISLSSEVDGDGILFRLRGVLFSSGELR